MKLRMTYLSELSINQMEEKQLRIRRDDLDRRLERTSRND